jgi:hypothetical protein
MNYVKGHLYNYCFSHGFHYVFTLGFFLQKRLRLFLFRHGFVTVFCAKPFLVNTILIGSFFFMVLLRSSTFNLPSKYDYDCLSYMNSFYELCERTLIQSLLFSWLSLRFYVRFLLAKTITIIFFFMVL